jgi:hypothetical protein
VNKKSFVAHRGEVVLDGMSNKARDSATFLLKAGKKSNISGGIYMEISHLHIRQRADCKGLIVIAHELGGKSHDLFKGDVVEIFN